MATSLFSLGQINICANPPQCDDRNHRMKTSPRDFSYSAYISHYLLEEEMAFDNSSTSFHT